MSKQTTYTLYKIYSENCLLYIGRTKRPLHMRLRGHFFKAPMHRGINIECVTKIEYATFPTEADMFLYEIYYINKCKPPLNRDDKAEDQLTVRLPEVPFWEYDCWLMGKWREEIFRRDVEDEEKQRLKFQIEKEKREKRKEIFSCKGLSDKQKMEAWWEWLVEYYEPVRNGLL